MKEPGGKPRPRAGVRPGPHFAQALQLYQQGQHQAATRILGPALRAEPGNAALWYLAGAVSKAQSHLVDAEQCWRRAIALAPGFPEAHHDLAVLLHEGNRIVEAIAIYRVAVRLAPEQVQMLNNFGAALAKLGQLDEAVQCFSRAVALSPQYAKAHHNLGRALANLGRFEQAHRSLETAIQFAPQDEKSRFHRTLAFLKRTAPGDPQLAQMEELAQEMQALPPDEQMELNFAMGKAYGDLGERERSFRHFLAGNRRKRELTPYDEAAALSRLERVRAAYTPELMAARQGQGEPSALPLFILGMPRSGSSLVEQILASHPQVHGAGECEEFRFLAEAVPPVDGCPLLPDGIAVLPEATLRKLGQDYLRLMQARAPQAVRITDKTLTNFIYLGLIHLALPGAKIIHTRRDAVDTCLSCFSHLFSGDHAYSYDLAELGRYWRAYDRLMEHWRQALPPGVILEVQYEDMVEDMEGQTRRLLAHCGLEWSDACLEFHKTERPVYTASVIQVREPIYRSSVQKWRAYEHLLQPLLQALAP
jgi:tetratricopeptide (TPR) repeat protein